MYSRVSGVQNRMQQTQIALLFPGLFVPPDGSANLEFGQLSYLHPSGRQERARRPAP